MNPNFTQVFHMVEHCGAALMLTPDFEGITLHYFAKLICHRQVWKSTAPTPQAALAALEDKLRAEIGLPPLNAA